MGKLSDEAIHSLIEQRDNLNERCNHLDDLCYELKQNYLVERDKVNTFKLIIAGLKLDLQDKMQYSNYKEYFNKLEKVK
jgi:hypothetical protein